MTVNAGLSQDPPTQPIGTGGSSSGLKAGSKVFRPGAVPVAGIATGGPGSPYGPTITRGTVQGALVNAIYNATDQEVGEILSGVDSTGDGTPLSPTFRRGLKDILLAAGFLSKRDYIPSTEFGSADYAAMRDLLKEANYLGGYNWREAVGLISDQIAAKGTGAAKTSTYTQYSLSRPEEAELIVDAALNNFLGRGATKEEKANLSKALRKYEQETPTVTTTTAGGTSTTSTTMTGPSAAGRQQAILGGFTEGQSREMSGVVNTELGNLFTTLLRNA